MNSPTQISLPHAEDNYACMLFLVYFKDFKWSISSVVSILWELELNMCEHPQKTETLHISIFGNITVFIQEQYSLGMDIYTRKNFRCTQCHNFLTIF